MWSSRSTTRTTTANATQTNSTTTSQNTTSSPSPGDSSSPSPQVSAITYAVSGNCVPIETIGAIAGGSSAAVLLLVLLGAALCFILIRMRRPKDKSGPLAQGGNISSPAKEVLKENVQNADVETPHQQLAAALETDLMQPAFFNGYMVDNVSSNRGHHLSSVGHECGPPRLSSNAEYATVMRSPKPNRLLVVEDIAGSYTSLRTQAIEPQNPYNTFEDFGESLRTHGKTSTSGVRISKASPDKASIHSDKSAEKPFSENMNPIVGAAYYNCDTDSPKHSVYENASSVVSRHMQVCNGESDNNIPKDKKKKKGKGKAKKYESGLQGEPSLEEQHFPSELSLEELEEQNIQNELSLDYYKPDRVYNNY